MRRLSDGAGCRAGRLEPTAIPSLSLSADRCPVATTVKKSNPATALCARDGTVVASFSTGHVRIFDAHKK